MNSATSPPSPAASGSQPAGGLLASAPLCLAALLLPLGHAGAAPPEDASAPPPVTTAAELLPDTVAAYAELPDAGQLFRSLDQHPLKRRWQSLPVVQRVMESEDVRPLRDLLAGFEASVGRPWIDAVANLTDGGLAVALDRPSRGVAVLLRSSDRQGLEHFRNFVLAIGQFEGRPLGMSRQASYRGYTAYAVNPRIKMAQLDDWLLLTNQSELGKAVIDRYVDRPREGGLNQSQAFNQALDAAGEHDAVGFLDVAAFRDAGVAAPLYRTPTENVFAEMLLGGIIATLAETPSAVAGLDVLEDAVRFDVSVPRRTAWVEGREHYFGEDGLATAPPLRHLEGSLLTLSSYRDLSQMWLLAPNLMNDRANEQLAKADTTLTTFFSGRDFGQDILGALEPELRLVVTRQTFAPSQPTPGIKLPAFALEARMRDPETASTELRRVFQSFVGFINVVGAMEGQPQLDLGMIESDSATLVTATYIRPSDTPDSEALPIQFNFSPTLAFAGRRLVLSSTTELAETLIHARDGGQRPKAGVNTQAVLQAGTLNEVLRDNRSQLVAQNMIEKGHSPEQAEAEIDVLLQLIDLARDASMQLRSGEDRLAVEVEVRLDDS